MNAHVDIQDRICDLLNDAGIDAWANRLPAGFDNTTPAAQVELDDDDWHQSGATRRASITLRIYGGSAKLVDVKEAVVDALDALQHLTTSEIAITGAFRVSEPLPEPDTGWPTRVIRFDARIKER